MADLEAARVGIRQAISLIVTRFGHDRDVVAILSGAIDALDADPAPIQAEVVAESQEPEPESESVAPPLEEPPVVAEVVTRKGAHGGRRGRTKRT